MKRIVLIALGLALTANLCISQTEREQTSPAILELKKVDRSIDDAYLRGDKDALELALAEGMLAVGPEGELTLKKEILKRVSPPVAGRKLSLVSEDVQVYLFGETAIVSSHKILTTSTANGSYSDQYRETNTFTRQGNGWQLIASQQSHAAPPYSARDVLLNFKVDTAYMKGSNNAGVVLIEFADYQCSHCRSFAQSTMKQIEQDYIDSGRVALVLRNNPLEDIHPQAFKAAQAARCAGAQGNFWQMHQLLFAEPMALTQLDLEAKAKTLKLDEAEFRKCMSDDKTAAAIRQEMIEAAHIGIQGTPIFLIGVKKSNSNDVLLLRKIEGAYPYEVFKEALDTTINARTP